MVQRNVFHSVYPSDAYQSLQSSVAITASLAHTKNCPRHSSTCIVIAWLEKLKLWRKDLPHPYFEIMVQRNWLHSVYRPDAYPSLQSSVAITASLAHTNTAHDAALLTSLLPDWRSFSSGERPPRPRNCREKEMKVYFTLDKKWHKVNAIMMQLVCVCERILFQNYF